MNQDRINLEFYKKVKEKLSDITEVESYKNLCSLLEEPEKTNPNTRQKQLDEWKKYFSFTMKGRKFTNIHVFSEEQMIQNDLEDLLSDSLNFSFLVMLVLYHSSKHQSYLLASDSSLARVLGLVSESFKQYLPYLGDIGYAQEMTSKILSLKGKKYSYLNELKEDIREDRLRQIDSLKKNKVKSPEALKKLDDLIIQKKNDYKKNNPSSFTPYPEVKDTLEDFYKHTIPTMKYQVQSMLKRLEKAGIISTETRHVGIKITNSGDSTFYQEEILTMSQWEQIFSLQNQVAKDLGYKSYAEVVRRNKLDSFSTKFEEQLLEKFGYSHVYKSNLIFFRPDTLLYDLYAFKEEVYQNNNFLLESLKVNNQEFIDRITKNKARRDLQEEYSNEDILTFYKENNFSFLIFCITAQELLGLSDSSLRIEEYLLGEPEFPESWLDLFNKSSSNISSFKLKENEEIKQLNSTLNSSSPTEIKPYDEINNPSLEDLNSMYYS